MSVAKNTIDLYMVYKFGGLSADEVLQNREDLFSIYGQEGWFIFDRDVKERFKDKGEIRNWCINFIKTLPPTTLVVVDVRNGVGRLGWEEIRACEEAGLKVVTYGGALPKERRYL